MSQITRTECPVCGHTTFETYRTCTDHTVSKETFPVVRCAGCGFRFTNPAPDEASIGAYYESEDYISHSNTSRGLVNSLYQVARRYMMGRKQSLVEKLAGTQSGKLLDYGCGTGEFAAHMQGRGWLVLGLEPSEAARRYANEQNKVPAAPPDVLFTDKLDKDTFSVITMWHVLEHVHRLHETIDRLHARLATGGLMIIAVPNADAREEATYREYWAAWDVPRHLYHFDAEAMGRLLAAHDLRIESAQPMPLDAFYVAMLSERYQHGKVNWFRATGEGYRTWQAARKDYRKASSLLYVVRSAKG